MTQEREINVLELAQQLGCSVGCAQRLIRSGQVVGRKTDRGWVTTREAVNAYQIKQAASVFGPSSRRRKRPW